MPTTPEEQAMIRAICADPWDDGPRLIYADWLDENGSAWHLQEVIRVQIHCGPMRSYTGYANSELIWHDKEATPDAPKLCRDLYGDFPGEVVVQRGFPMEWRCHEEDYKKHARDVFSRWPLVKVELTDRQPWVETVDLTPRAQEASWIRLHPWDARPYILLEGIFDALQDGERVEPVHASGMLGSLPVQRVYRDKPEMPGGISRTVTHTAWRDSMADLCQATVAYGRQLAGLPPLTSSVAR